MTGQGARARRGVKARLDSRRSEILCALWLMAKGYRILGFRLKTPQAEIDLLVQKKNVVAVVEVKRRTSLEAALDAVTWRQRERLRRRPVRYGAPAGLAGAAIRLDLVALARALRTRLT